MNRFVRTLTAGLRAGKDLRSAVRDARAADVNAHADFEPGDFVTVLRGPHTGKLCEVKDVSGDGNKVRIWVGRVLHWVAAADVKAKYPRSSKDEAGCTKDDLDIGAIQKELKKFGFHISKPHAEQGAKRMWNLPNGKRVTLVGNRGTIDDAPTLSAMERIRAALGKTSDASGLWEQLPRAELDKYFRRIDDLRAKVRACNHPQKAKLTNVIETVNETARKTGGGADMVKAWINKRLEVVERALAGGKVQDAEFAGLTQDASPREIGANGGFPYSKRFGVPRAGKEVDFYEPGTGNKLYGKVVSVTGESITIQASKGGTFTGKTYRLKLVQED
jgi:hypothetical protein